MTNNKKDDKCLVNTSISWKSMDKNPYLCTDGASLKNMHTNKQTKKSLKSNKKKKMKTLLVKLCV